MEIDVKERDANILHMKQYVEEEDLLMPDLAWFRDQGIDLPIIERTTSPYPDSLKSLYYPGRIRIGALPTPKANPDDSDNPDVWVYAYLNKANTTNDTLSVEYFRDTHEGKASKVVQMSVDKDELRPIHFLPWTNLVMDINVTSVGRGPWATRINFLVKIALLLAGFFDGRVITQSKDTPPNKLFKQTLASVKTNLFRRRMQIERQRVSTNPGTHATNAGAQDPRPQKRKQYSILSLKYDDAEKKTTALKEKTTALEEDLQKHQATTVETARVLKEEIETLKKEIVTQKSEFERVEKLAKDQEGTISAQQEGADRDRRFRDQHDKECRPILLTLYKDMFLRNGLNNEEADAMASATYQTNYNGGPT
ncbi:hypothetical protein N0V83_003498 [Neocucurbitaria cava]|uniref:Uncharacterized protein n=1 Tax=Neocucurbitaria cava TaxID=798079 RepID=A0A9W8YBI6_9PLEO|nr:hypothetical protein N0V83_003498 [Neocucurbitaria cava]